MWKSGIIILICLSLLFVAVGCDSDSDTSIDAASTKSTISNTEEEIKTWPTKGMLAKLTPFAQKVDDFVSQYYDHMDCTVESVYIQQSSYSPFKAYCDKLVSEGLSIRPESDKLTAQIDSSTDMLAVYFEEKEGIWYTIVWNAEGIQPYQISVQAYTKDPLGRHTILT